MPVILAEIGSYVFYTLIAALFAGRVGLLILKLAGYREAATLWANTFNRFTVYLRP